MGVKISQLDNIVNLQDGCCLPIVSDGETRKINYGTLKERLNEDLNIGGTTPVGTISLWAGETAPKNYLICDGQAISRSIYADLFNIIGTTYGSGDGSTTFNIPDYRGLVPVGLKVNEEYFNTLGKTGGETTHLLTINEIPSHTHHLMRGGQTFITGSGAYAGVLGDWGEYDTGATGGSNAHNNLQPYIVQNYIIKVSKEATEETLVEAVPMGTILDYDGDTVPVGYEEVSNWKSLPSVLGNTSIDISNIDFEEIIIKIKLGTNATTRSEDRVFMIPIPKIAISSTTQTYRAGAGYGSDTLGVSVQVNTSSITTTIAQALTANVLNATETVVFYK